MANDAIMELRGESEEMLLSSESSNSDFSSDDAGEKIIDEDMTIMREST